MQRCQARVCSCANTHAAHAQSPASPSQAAACPTVLSCRFSPVFVGWVSLRHCTALRCAAVRSQVKQAGAQQGCPAKHSPGVLPASAAAVAAALLTTSAWLGNAVQPAVAAVYVDQLPSSGAATSTMVARERPDRATALRAPTLTAHGDDMRESVHDIVESGITDIVGSSMSAVGGPVTADMLLEPHSHQHAALDEQQPVAGPTKQLQPAAAQAQPQHQPWCGMWAAYCNALEASPLCTKTCIGIAGTLLGDTAAQLLAHARTANRQRTRFVFDAPRAARLCLYSAAIGTPMGHFWYALLDSAVPGDPTSAAVVIAKLAADQLLQVQRALWRRLCRTAQCATLAHSIISCASQQLSRCTL